MIHIWNDNWVSPSEGHRNCMMHGDGPCGGPMGYDGPPDQNGHTACYKLGNYGFGNLCLRHFEALAKKEGSL